MAQCDKKFTLKILSKTDSNIDYRRCGIVWGKILIQLWKMLVVKLWECEQFRLSKEFCVLGWRDWKSARIPCFLGWILVGYELMKEGRELNDSISRKNVYCTVVEGKSLNLFSFGSYVYSYCIINILVLF